MNANGAERQKKSQSEVMPTTRMPAILSAAQVTTTKSPARTPWLGTANQGDIARDRRRRAWGRSPCRRCWRPARARLPEIPRNCRCRGGPTRSSRLHGQRARKFADHEGGRQAPENRERKQNQNAVSVAGAGDDLFGAVGAAGNHEEGSSHQRPERELGDIFFGWRDCPRGEVGGKG